jgi:glutathionyl-hydroquinone reductase
MQMKKTRQRVKHIKSFEQRLLEEAARFRAAAALAQPGTERELLLRRMRQLEDASRMNEWLKAP